MESGDLKIFQAVAREGSITKAALRLGYVQSNVTARIRQLEAELNTSLLHRQSRGVSLTPAGENLLKYADKIVYLLDEAFKSTRNSETPSGSLRIGSLETTAAVQLPGMMLEYHRSYPEVKLSLSTGHTSDLVRKVLDYELDAAFVNGPQNHPDLEELFSFEEEMVLIAEPGEASLQTALTKPQLFIGKGCFHRKKLEHWLEEHQQTLNSMEFGTLEAILGGVSAGLGVSLVTRSSVKTWEEAGKIRVFSIPEKYRRSVVKFVFRRDLFRTSAFEKFVEQIRHFSERNETSKALG
ncbi:MULTISPECIES: LysR family transcriptional regulator [Paenibacillus]|uniref:HTH-type transcriptional regulator YusT n=1 Tax=Paenibacillus albilobatus TaxID=2716884 RepID=A0A919XKQ2_9BACL|nr:MULTISPECIES: LysR family transcriptional regulator [Paenibacillus]GIO32610.1 putative HTH-type transcriptional regulator YusT [Paenibacillus albilobatus]